MYQLNFSSSKVSLALKLGVVLGLASCYQNMAFAQSQGAWLASVGVTSLNPSVSSGNLSSPSLANTQVGINSNSQLTGAVSYMLSDHWSLSAPIGMGFKHNITGAGAIAGTGVIGTTRALPVTGLVQYRLFDANDAFRPYVGAGLTYAKFFDSQGTGTLTGLTNPGSSVPTTLSIDSKFAATVQLGITYNLTDVTFLDVNLTKTGLTTNSYLSTGQSISMGLNPVTYSLGIGYKF
jgi:outer membrane protein